jgi:hypothetical protein
MNRLVLIGNGFDLAHGGATLQELIVPVIHKNLSLAVGYNAVRDTALVEVKEITFEPAKNEDGTPIRLRLEASQLVPDTNGDLCLWLVVYHLGEVVNVKRKSE